VGAEATGSTIAAASASSPPALLDLTAARPLSSTTPARLPQAMANNIEAGTSTGGTGFSLSLDFYLDQSDIVVLLEITELIHD
jgi:hypothetical protein